MSPDGARLWATVSGPTDDVIQEWDLATGLRTGSYQSVNPASLVASPARGGWC